MRQAFDWHKNTFLGQLEPDMCDDILSLGAERRFEPHDVLIRRGESGRHVFVLLSGWVRITAENAAGKVTLLAVRIEGELVGELACLDDEPRSATVTASRQGVRARVIAQQDFQRFVNAHPDVGVVTCRSVGAKLRWATRHRIDVSEPGERRLARVVYELAGQFGVRLSHDAAELGMFTQEDLGAFAGAGVATTQRSIRKLKDEGLIKVVYRGVRIPDMNKLREYAGLTGEA